MTGNAAAPARNVIFISKGTPEDDDFVLWLAPRLEALGKSHAIAGDRAMIDFGI